MRAARPAVPVDLPPPVMLALEPATGGGVTSVATGGAGTGGAATSGDVGSGPSTGGAGSAGGNPTSAASSGVSNAGAIGAVNTTLPSAAFRPAATVVRSSVAWAEMRPVAPRRRPPRRPQMPAPEQASVAMRTPTVEARRAEPLRSPTPRRSVRSSPNRSGTSSSRSRSRASEEHHGRNDTHDQPQRERTVDRPAAQGPGRSAVPLAAASVLGQRR